MAEPTINQSLFPDTTLSGTLTGAAQSVTIATPGIGSLALEISGTWTGTLQFEGIVDPVNGTFRAIPANLIATSGPGVSATAANGSWIISAAGCNQVRVRASAFASGTANVYFEGTFISTQVAIGAGQPPIPVTTSPTFTTRGMRIGVVSVTSATITAIHKSAYTEQIVNFTGSVHSSSASDTAAGVGARTVLITYLDQTGAGPFTETVTLNGTTAVNLVNTNHCYIESMVVQTVGVNGASNVGTLTLFTGAGATGTNVASILPTDNTLFYAQHYVPAGMIGYVTSVTAYSDVSGSYGGTLGASTNFGSYVYYKSKTIGASIATSPETVMLDVTGNTVPSQTVQRLYTTPIPIVGPARILGYVTTLQSATNNYFSTLDFYDQ